MDILKRNTETQKEIGGRIRTLRRKKGVTQGEIANLLDMKPAGYSKLESGGSALGYEHCITLANYFDTTCDYILRGIKSENVDICSRTCLTQQSVDALMDLHDDFKTNNREYREFLDNRSKEDCESHHFSSVDEIRAYWKEQDIQSEIEFNMRNSVYFGQIVNYLVNALVQNKNFLNGLSRACFDCASAILNDIYITSRYGFNLESKRGTYRKGINAAKYEAGQIFGNFFIEFCRDADFISSLFELPEDDLIFALEKGLLFHFDD